MKRIIWLLALICFMVCSTSVYAAVSVQLNGDLIDFTDSNGNKVEAQIINSRTMVPMRKIFELLNAKVEWNAENKTVIAAQNDILIQLQIDNDIAELTKNGVTEKIKLDAKPVIVDDRTLVPLRFISESLNKQVGWDSENATAIIIDYDYFLNKIKEKSPLLSELLLTNPKNFSLNITRTYTDLITNHEEVSNVMVDEKEDSNGVENVKIRFEGTSELFREIVSEGWDDVDLTIAYLEDGISYSTTNSVLEKMLLQKEEKFADLHLEGTTRDSFGDMIKNQLNINEKSMNITTFQSITEEFNQFLSLFRYNNTASSSSIIANNINYQNANLTKADFTKFDNIIFDNKVLNLYNIINRLLFNYDIELEKLLYDYSNIDVNLSVIKNENHLSMNTTVELTNDYQEKVVYQILLNEQ